MAVVSKVLIVGGGIAGLAAAIALGRRGVACDIVEITSEYLGSGIGISGQAVVALNELGVLEACQAVGNPPMEMVVLKDAAGETMGGHTMGAGRPAEESAIPSNMTIYRPELLGVMRKAAEALHGPLRIGVTVQKLDQQADGVEVEFTDGSRGVYDLVVGADGIGSSIRQTYFPGAPEPKYSGQYSIRWIAPGPEIPGYSAFYHSKKGKLGGYPLPQGFIYVVTTLSIPEKRFISASEAEALFVELLDSFTAPYVVELRRRFTSGANLICRPFEWLLMPPPWRNGRVLLIGDAAHATTAHMGMGGGMALEDGVVLGQCVDSAANLDEALDSFMSRRFDRAQTVVQTSVAMSEAEQRGVSPVEASQLAMGAFGKLRLPY